MSKCGALGAKLSAFEQKKSQGPCRIGGHSLGFAVFSNGEAQDLTPGIALFQAAHIHSVATPKGPPSRLWSGLFDTGFKSRHRLVSYRHILRPELNVPREQLKDPSTELITDFCLWRNNQLRNARAILIIRDPPWIRSLAVQMDGYLVFFPRSGDTDLYTRIAERAKQLGSSEDSFDVRAIEALWPTRPIFSMDFDQGLAGLVGGDGTEEGF